MAKWALVVETNLADPAREAELKEWYTGIHLPDILLTPGFLKSTLYENTEPSGGKAKFLIVNEMEADDIVALMKKHSENMDRKRAEGRIAGNLTVRVSRGVYKQVGSVRRRAR
ncbi:MAG: hypothetical protein HY673_11560 [Chloroflexi bacterium]|nr:hypothetical protein [Chloroflexota bacterium]